MREASERKHAPSLSQLEERHRRREAKHCAEATQQAAQQASEGAAKERAAVEAKMATAHAQEIQK